MDCIASLHRLTSSVCLIVELLAIGISKHEIPHLQYLHLVDHQHNKKILLAQYHSMRNIVLSWQAREIELKLLVLHVLQILKIVQ